MSFVNGGTLTNLITLISRFKKTLTEIVGLRVQNLYSPVAIAVYSYFLLTIVFNLGQFNVLIHTKDLYLLPFPENMPIYLDNYYHVLIGDSTWNDRLSSPDWGTDFLSYRTVFWIVGKFLDLNLTNIIVIEKLAIHFLAFSGSFVLSRYYIKRYSSISNNQLIILAAFVAGLFYGSNPSFMIGDYMWVGIQFAFAFLPWLAWAFSKAVLEGKWQYIFPSALLIAVNIDEHFLWVGFPIFLALFSIAIFLKRSVRQRYVDWRPIAAFFLVMVTFVALTSYRLINRISSFSDTQTSTTTLGLGIPWMNATLQNMLRAMSHMSVDRMYASSDPSASFLNSLMPLSFAVPILAIIVFVFKRNSITIFFGSLLSLAILPFFSNSPLKELHNFIFFETFVGPAFRTWRISDAYISLSLSVLLAFSLYYIFQSCYKGADKKKAWRTPLAQILRPKLFSYFLLFFLIFSIGIYSWPLYTGNINKYSSPIKVPEEYIDLHAYLSAVPSSRILYVPDFIYSGVGSSLNPSWNKEFGMLQEFLNYPSQTTISPTGWYSHFYDYSVSFSYPSLLNKKDLGTLSNFLASAGIEYLVVHNDIPALVPRVDGYINLLNQSEYFEQVYKNGFISLYKNSAFRDNVYAPPYTILVDGGYRAVRNVYDRSANSSSLGFVYMDQLPSIELDNYKIILTDKSRQELIKDIVFSQADKSNVVYPYQTTFEYDPANKWSRASFFDPHQNAWHPYVKLTDYAWDFDYMKGVAMTAGSKDSLTISLNNASCDRCVLLVRYFQNDNGGNMRIKIANNELALNSKGSYNGFLWFEAPINLHQEKKTVTIINEDGFNALSAVMLVPEKQYYQLYDAAINYIDGSQILVLSDSNAANILPIHDRTHLIENDGFENGISGWIPDKNVEAVIDNDAPYDGLSSLKISPESNDQWTWLFGQWIDVNANDIYSIVTHIKGKNIDSAHIVVEGMDSIGKRTQIVQVPKAHSGSFNWTEYKMEFTIPTGITKIRIDLNGGKAIGNSASTWFDDIHVNQVKVNMIKASTILNSHSGDLSPKKVENTRWIVTVSSTKPSTIALTESYNPLWQATSANNQVVRSIPINSVINGFILNTGGTTVISYEPQKLYNIQIVISILTLILWTGFIFRSYVPIHIFLKRRIRHLRINKLSW